MTVLHTWEPPTNSTADSVPCKDIVKKIHNAHTQSTRASGSSGPNLTAMNMQNNSFRAAYAGGHELNESYKKPAPNASGENLSYHHPVVDAGRGSNTQKLSAKQKTPAGPIQAGKNMA